MLDESSQRKTARRLLGPGLLVFLALVIGGLAYTARPWATENPAPDSAALGMLTDSKPRPGEPAPNFALTDQEGRRVELADFSGRPVFLNFWADWCTFCKEEMPDMQRVADEYGDRLVVLGVNAGDSVETGERFVERTGISYQRLYDLDLEVTEGYGISAMPTSFFVDASGRIVDFNFGFMTYEQMLAKLQPLVGGS